MRTTITIMMLGLLCSCGSPTNELDAGRNIPDGIIPFDEAVHFKYKGHQYIKFTGGYGQYKICGVVHDPDCKYCKR